MTNLTTSKTPETDIIAKNGNEMEDFSSHSHRTDNKRHYWTTKTRKNELLLCCQIDAWFCAKTTIAKNTISKRPYSVKNYSVFTPDMDLIIDQLINAYQKSPFYQENSSTSCNSTDSNERSSSTSALKEEFKKYVNKYLKKKHSAFHRSLLPFLFFCYILRCNESQPSTAKKSSTKQHRNTFYNIDFSIIPLLNAEVSPLSKQLLSEIKNIYPNLNDRFKHEFDLYRDNTFLSYSLNFSKICLFFFAIYDSLEDDFDKLNFFYMLSDCFYQDTNEETKSYFLPKIYTFKHELPFFAYHKKTPETISTLLENGCLATAMHIYYSISPSLTKNQLKHLTTYKKELTEAYIKDTQSHETAEKDIHKAVSNDDFFSVAPPKSFLKELVLPLEKVIPLMFNEVNKKKPITPNLIHEMVEEANAYYDSEEKQRICSHFRSEFEVFFHCHESGELEYPISTALARMLRNLLPNSVESEVDKYLACATYKERYQATAALAEKIASLFPCSLSSELYNFFFPSEYILECNYRLENLSDSIEELLLYCKLELKRGKFQIGCKQKFENIFKGLYSNFPKQENA